MIFELKTVWEFRKTNGPQPRNIANPAGKCESAFEHALIFYLVCFLLRKTNTFCFLVKCGFWSQPHEDGRKICIRHLENSTFEKSLFY